MSSALFIIIHKATPIALGQPNGGAEMASLYLAQALSNAGKRVILAAQFSSMHAPDSAVEYWDLGAHYDVESALQQADALGEYHLIAQHAVPIMISKHHPACLSRMLLVEERSGGSGLGMDTLSQVCDMIVCVSNKHRSNLIEEGATPRKTVVAYNGVDLDTFQPTNKITRDWNRLLFVGALVPDKGIHYLVQAFAELKVKYPALLLDVYGSAKLWHREEFINPTEIQQAVPGITFHGAVSPSELVQAYQRAGVCVVPSIWFEPFGMVAADALATGCPVVTFDVGGPAEIVLDSINGLVLKDVSVEGLVNGLDQLIANPQRLQQLSQGSIAHRERFDWKIMAQQFITMAERSTRAPAALSSKSQPHKKHNTKKISVVTVSYNHGEFIRDTIESVLAQDYDNFEHIIIDGGSSDNTVEILKEYPHLDWVSESDRGQSHALNKGFAKATGDIVVWLNSDDWLEPDCFKNIIPALEDHNTVIAPARHTDREKNLKEIIPNTARNWEDLLKFWVPFAWFAQVSIFFKREFLESVRLPDGSYVDEELYYVMDIDLWLRMAAKEPFYNRIEYPCASFRMYEENKTGADGEAAQRECSRLFRRYCHKDSAPERRFSVLLPVDTIDDELAATVESLCSQSLQDIEVLLIGYGENVNGRALEKTARSLDARIPPYCVRAIQSNKESLLAAYNTGISHMRGAYVILMRPGDRLSNDFLLEMERSFVYDWVGIALPLQSKPRIRQTLSEGAAQEQITLGGLFSTPMCSPALAARSTTLKQLGGFHTTDSLVHGVKELLVRALHQSWHVLIDRPLAISEKHSYGKETEIYEAEHSLVIAKLITTLDAEAKGQPFFESKKNSGNAIVFTPELLAEAKQLLALK